MTHRKSGKQRPSQIPKDTRVKELPSYIYHLNSNKYGDSPMCCGELNFLDGTQALVQGFGLTEKGQQSTGLLQVIFYETVSVYYPLNQLLNEINLNAIVFFEFVFTLDN